MPEEHEMEYGTRPEGDFFLQVELCLQALGFQSLVGVAAPPGFRAFMCTSPAALSRGTTLICLAPTPPTFEQIAQVGSSLRRGEDMIVVTPTAQKQLVETALRPMNDRVQVLSLRDIVDRLADLSQYESAFTSEVGRDGIRYRYVDHGIREIGRANASVARAQSLEFLSEWLLSDIERNLLVLGDFGAGKTWLARQFCAVSIAASTKDPDRSAVPIYVSLSRFPEGETLENVVVSELTERFRCKLPFGYYGLDKLFDLGYAFLVLDGLDEMERRISPAISRRLIFEVLRPAMATRRVVLTSRLSFFASEQDALECFGGAEANFGSRLPESAVLPGGRRFCVGILQPFTQAEVSSAAYLAAVDAPGEISNSYPMLNGDMSRIVDSDVFRDLVVRPGFLSSIIGRLTTFDDNTEGLNLFAWCVEEVLDKNVRHKRCVLNDVAQKRRFLERLAWFLIERLMVCGYAPSIRAEDLPNRVTNGLDIGDLNPQWVVHDLRSQTLLRFEPNTEDEYAFISDSVLAYLAARHLIEDARNASPIGSTTWARVPLAPTEDSLTERARMSSPRTMDVDRVSRILRLIRKFLVGLGAAELLAVLKDRWQAPPTTSLAGRVFLGNVARFLVDAGVAPKAIGVDLSGIDRRGLDLPADWLNPSGEESSEPASGVGDGGEDSMPWPSPAWTEIPLGMVLVPGGSLPKGVAVESFLMDAHEVTNREFCEFVGDTHDWARDVIAGGKGGFSKRSNVYHLLLWKDGSPPRDLLDHPVTYVSWFAAAAFCNWRTARARAAGWLWLTEFYDAETLLPTRGNGFRLPYATEYEFALRAGASGDAPDNAKRCSRFCKSEFSTAPVMSDAPNRWGVSGLGTNVREWCGEGGKRATRPIRGATPYRVPDSLAFGFSSRVLAVNTNIDVGFRCVLSVTSTSRAGKFCSPDIVRPF